MSTQINTGGPAFPVTINDDLRTDCATTLRDYFAAKALTGLVAVHGGGDLHTHYIHKAGSRGDNDITYPEAIAAHCYAIADAMLKAREVKL